MVPTGSRQRPDGPGLIYVTRFASHRRGVWQLRGLRGFGHRGPGLGAHSALEQAAVEQGPLGGDRPAGSQARVTDAPDSASLQPRSRAPRDREQAARAGLNQKNAAKEFDFPIPLNEASKLTKKRKKASVWNKVHQVISRMIAENESYRDRLKCQHVSSEAPGTYFALVHTMSKRQLLPTPQLQMSQLDKTQESILDKSTMPGISERSHKAVRKGKRAKFS